MPRPGSRLIRTNTPLQQDVELGQEAAAEARKQLPMLNDGRVDDYVERVGENLVMRIPPEFRHAEFRYTFDVVNQKEINAFALPGGPMFLNRGMIEASKNEAEMAGVMAHEISHVRFATAPRRQRRDKSSRSARSQARFSGPSSAARRVRSSHKARSSDWAPTSSSTGREYERQADLLGAQIMARAGYDPRAMASMFQTIQAEGGRSGPEWLSSHPDPGNRSNAITQEASMLRVQGNADTGQFASIQSRLRGMSPAYTAEQIAQGQARTRSVGTAGRSGECRAAFDAIQNLHSVKFPARERPGELGAGQHRRRWRHLRAGGWLRSGNSETAFTHGIEIGVATGGSGNLQRDSQQLLDNFARTNPQLERAGSTRRVSIGGRQGLSTPLANVSEVTGQREYVNLSTAQLRDGTILYLIGVAPQTEAATYERAFQRVRDTLQIADR